LVYPRGGSWADASGFVRGEVLLCCCAVTECGVCGWVVVWNVAFARALRVCPGGKGGKCNGRDDETSSSKIPKGAGAVQGRMRTGKTRLGD